MQKSNSKKIKMKSLLIASITIYQKIISPLLHQLLGIKKACRYEKTCASYAKDVIEIHGILKGLGLAARRILTCQPYFTL
jgi:uncharacterized protein